MYEIPCTIMRGGTSKGLFFLDEDLPEDPVLRDKAISKAFGSPDPSGLQINGLGGTLANMNKLAVISRREGEPNTVNYNLGQIDIYSWIVDRKANCGNISSAVGPYAIDHGLIDHVTEPITEVRIYNVNTKKYIVAHVPVKDGRTDYEGNFEIAGINRPGSKIRLDFLDPGGAATGRLLPTGNLIDVVETEHYGSFELSCIDAANPFLFVRARDLGLKGTELPEELLGIPGMVDQMLEIREAAAVLMGFATTREQAREHCKAVPKFCMVAPAQPYTTVGGAQIGQAENDLAVRMLSMGKPLPSLATTGAVCIAVASKLTGSIVQEMLSEEANSRNDISIGHPGGILPASVAVEKTPEGFHAVSGTIYRTARLMMSGTVYIPAVD